MRSGVSSAVVLVLHLLFTQSISSTHASSQFEQSCFPSALPPGVPPGVHDALTRCPAASASDQVPFPSERRPGPVSESKPQFCGRAQQQILPSAAASQSDASSASPQKLEAVAVASASVVLQPSTAQQPSAPPPAGEVSTVYGADIGELSREWTRASRALVGALWTSAHAAARDAHDIARERVTAAVCRDGGCFCDAHAVLQSSTAAPLAGMVRSTFSSAEQAWTRHILGNVERVQVSSRQAATRLGLGPWPELLLSSMSSSPYAKTAIAYVRPLLQTAAVKFDPLRNIAAVSQHALVRYGIGGMAAQLPARLLHGHPYLQGVASAAHISLRIFGFASKLEKLGPCLKSCFRHVLSRRGLVADYLHLSPKWKQSSQLYILRAVSGISATWNSTKGIQLLSEIGNRENGSFGSSVKTLRTRMTYLYSNPETLIQYFSPETSQTRLKFCDLQNFIADKRIAAKMRLAIVQCQAAWRDEIYPSWLSTKARCSVFWTEQVQPNISSARIYATTKTRTGNIVAMNWTKSAAAFLTYKCLPLLWHQISRLGTATSSCLKTTFFTTIKPGSLAVFTFLKRLCNSSADAALVLSAALVSVGTWGWLRALAALRYYGVNPVLESTAAVLESTLLAISPALDRMNLVAQNIVYVTKIAIILIGGGLSLFLSSVVVTTLASIAKMSRDTAEALRNTWQYAASGLTCWQGCESTRHPSPDEWTSLNTDSQSIEDLQDGKFLPTTAEMLSRTDIKTRATSVPVPRDVHARDTFERSPQAVQSKRSVPIPTFCKGDSVEQSPLQEAGQVLSPSLDAGGTSFQEEASRPKSEENEQPNSAYGVPLQRNGHQTAISSGSNEGTVMSGREFSSCPDLMTYERPVIEQASNKTKSQDTGDESALLLKLEIAIPRSSELKSGTKGPRYPDEYRTSGQAGESPELSARIRNASLYADTSGNSAASCVECPIDITNQLRPTAPGPTREDCLSSFQSSEQEKKARYLPSQGARQKPGAPPATTRTTRGQSSKALPLTKRDRPQGSSSVMPFPVPTRHNISGPRITGHVDGQPKCPAPGSTKDDEDDDVIFVERSIRRLAELKLVYGSPPVVSKSDVTQPAKLRRLSPKIVSTRKSNLPRPTRRAGMVTKSKQQRSSPLDHRASSLPIVIDD